MRARQPAISLGVSGPEVSSKLSASGAGADSVPMVSPTPVPVVEAVHVSKSFGDTPVLDDVSVAVEPGQVLVVHGENGTGKTTLLRCLAGWDRFDSGEVFFRGGWWHPESPTFRAEVACGLGGSDHFLELTVREHLEFVARGHGDPQPDALISAVLAELGLTRVAEKFPYALSQGQRRRLGLAACFVRPRALLILDEPEQNLDARGREWLAERLLAERDAGVAVIVSSHDRGLIDAVADLEVVLEIPDEAPGEDGLFGGADGGAVESATDW